MAPANEIPVMQKMKMVNTARGRKGAWFRKNATKWDRVDNKKREQESRKVAEFIQEFAFSDTITIEDDGSGKPYTFILRPPMDDVLGVMAYGRLFNDPEPSKEFEPHCVIYRASTNMAS
jgi:hypothetical protein